MIELERHIEILLLSNDCVIVPDFGGFMAHHVEARYDEQDAMFLPPLRTIGFNPQLTLNDSLLAQSYIEAYDISYPEALRRIGDEVRELRQMIESHGSYELNDLGTIRINQDGKYEFEPCEAGILSPELYGLVSFEMPRLSAVHAITPAPTTTATSTAPEPTGSATQTASATPFIIEEDEADDEATIRVSTLRNIAVACIAIFAFFAISSPINNNSTTSKAQINTSMLTRIIPHDVSLSPTAAKPKALVRQDSTMQAASTAAAPTEELADTFYTVVLCSRVSVKNATLYVGQLHSAGLTQASIYTKGKYTKVIYGKYATEKEARAKAGQLNGRHGIADSWVTKVTNR